MLATNSFLSYNQGTKRVFKGTEVRGYRQCHVDIYGYLIFCLEKGCCGVRGIRR